jgi:aryl-alcohol dehydrogenase-like predicted oxidoreductase
MRQRLLGKSGLKVSPFCLGGNVFGWTIDRERSFAVLDAYVAAGFEFIDTADVYSVWHPGNQGGESETILGEWFQHTGKRKQVVLATKVGLAMTPEKKGLSKQYILTEVEESLRRLQTDYIDLYQSHTDDETVPQEETLAAYDELIRAGKVRAIGASNFSAARLASALEIAQQRNLPAYSCLQPEYNLYDREKFEADLAGVCRQHEVGVICYFSLARGFLSGKYRNEADLAKSARGSSVQRNYFNDRGWRILQALDHVADELNATPAQIALAWLIAQPLVTAPIASATSVEQLQELLGAVSLRLDEASLKKLNDASAY